MFTSPLKLRLEKGGTLRLAEFTHHHLPDTCFVLFFLISFSFKLEAQLGNPNWICCRLLLSHCSFEVPTSSPWDCQAFSLTPQALVCLHALAPPRRLWMVLQSPGAVYLPAKWHKVNPVDLEVYSVWQEKKEGMKIDTKDWEHKRFSVFRKITTWPHHLKELHSKVRNKNVPYVKIVTVKFKLNKGF